MFYLPNFLALLGEQTLELLGPEMLEAGEQRGNISQPLARTGQSYSHSSPHWMKSQLCMGAGWARRDTGPAGRQVTLLFSAEHC